MEDLGVSLIVILITGATVAGIFIGLAARKRKQDSALVLAAAERGWAIQKIQHPLISGYRISGQLAGGGWALESRRDASPTSAAPGSSEVSLNTVWYSEAARLLGRAVVIGALPSGAGAASVPSFADDFILMGLRAMLGADAEWTGRLKKVELNDPLLGGRFLALADDAADVARLLDGEAVRLLAGLPQKYRPVVKLRENGLTVSLQGWQLVRPEEIQQLVSLGAALLKAWNSQ